MKIVEFHTFEFYGGANGTLNLSMLFGLFCCFCCSCFFFRFGLELCQISMSSFRIIILIPKVSLPVENRSSVVEGDYFSLR
jgi:hypothetical protein